MYAQPLPSERGRRIVLPFNQLPELARPYDRDSESAPIEKSRQRRPRLSSALPSLAAEIFDSMELRMLKTNFEAIVLWHAASLSFSRAKLRPVGNRLLEKMGQLVTSAAVLPAPARSLVVYSSRGKAS
jgi:hypothetical protein